jgi:Fe(3+) dicitrate transport protein
MPGAGIHYSVVEHLGVLAGVYRGFSPPPPGSNDSVEPEYSLNYEAGARYDTPRSRISWIGFFNDYSNLTNICTLSGGCTEQDLDRQFDAGKANIYGYEAYLEHAPRWQGVSFPVTAAYTYTRGEFENDFSSADPIYGEVSRGDEVPYLPRHQANATLGVDWSHSGTSFAVNYVSRMREEAGSEPLHSSLATDDLFTLDVGSKIMPLENFTLYGNVRNVLGTQRIVSRRPYGARPNAPTWVQVGAKLDF